jgi:23S rRNA (cytidine1920-2'-O)/16S rRNA (cytidine1409-2'-O)-methyltransferase
MTSNRLDMEMVKRGLCDSRAKAQFLISANNVSVDGKTARKASQKVSDQTDISVSGTDHKWVGRGALKLLAALDHFQIDPAGRIAADIGASTGGFTEVLLKRDVQKVYAVDVGHDQLHPSLLGNETIVNLEGINARNLTRKIIPEPLSLVVSDVSFISLKKALPAALELCEKNAVLATLVKPQFEVGRENLGKGGIVKDLAIAQKSAADISSWIETLPGWRSLGIIESPIKGSDGNTEFLLGAVNDT